MSRWYDISIQISGTREDRWPQIIEACEEWWDFEDSWDYFCEGNMMSASGSGNLCGGHTPEELTEELSIAVWRANVEYCKVEVGSLCLEYLPWDTHELDEDDYNRLMFKRQQADHETD